MNIYDFADEEHRLTHQAEETHGNYFINAACTSIAYSRLVGMPVTDCETFFRFHAQAKKHHTLSVLSTVRRHRTQAKLNLRYYLESTVQAAYSLAHQDVKLYFDVDQLTFVDRDTVAKRANKWLSEKYPASSAEILRVKNDINSQDAHSSIAASGGIFGYDQNERAIITSFFDFEDNEIIQADLWVCAQAGLVGLDLLLAVRDQFGGFLSERDIVEEFQRLREANALLFNEMLSKPRWAKFRAGTP
jgi:hypothetical protein